MESKKFTSKHDLEIQIRIDDDGCEIAVFHLDKNIGSISLVEKNDPNGFYYYITDLSLEKCKNQGIGQACLEYHKELFDTPITAASTFNAEEISDGSHLIGDGVWFINNMREKGIVCSEFNEYIDNEG